MFERLEELDARYRDVQSQLMDPKVTSQPDQLRELGKLNAELEPTVLTFRALEGGARRDRVGQTGAHREHPTPR